MGGARSSGGAPRSVVDDPLLGPPPGAEDEQPAGWEVEEPEEEEEEEAGVQQSLSPETSVPPPSSSVTAPVFAPVTVPVDGYVGFGVVGSDRTRAAAPAEIGARHDGCDDWVCVRCVFIFTLRQS